MNRIVVKMNLDPLVLKIITLFNPNNKESWMKFVHLRNRPSVFRRAATVEDWSVKSFYEEPKSSFPVVLLEFRTSEVTSATL